MINTYLFDFDGTLVDSMPTYVSAMLRVLDDCNFPHPPGIIKTITPLGLNGTADYYVSLGIGLPKDRIIEKMAHYMLDAYYHTIPAKEYVIPALQELKARGASLNVLTASPHITLDACLKRLGLFELFDHVWSCDDFATTKANPDIYRMAAGRLGVPVEDVLFLDDNPNADAAARAAGMRVCGVFDASSAEYEADMRAANDAYIRDFRELLTLNM